MRLLAIGIAASSVLLMPTIPIARAQLQNTERELVDALQSTHRSKAGKSRMLTGKRRTVGGDSQYMNLRMQDQMGQYSKARTIQTGVAKKQDEKKGMVKKMK